MGKNIVEADNHCPTDGESLHSVARWKGADLRLGAAPVWGCPGWVFEPSSDWVTACLPF